VSNPAKINNSSAVLRFIYQKEEEKEKKFQPKMDRAYFIYSAVYFFHFSL
jgi:hypothetical protein